MTFTEHKCIECGINYMDTATEDGLCDACKDDRAVEDQEIDIDYTEGLIIK
jgi:hypothetical protein